MMELFAIGVLCVLLAISIYAHIRMAKTTTKEITELEMRNAESIKENAAIINAEKIRDEVQNEPMDVVRADMRKRMLKRQGKDKL